MLTSSFQEYRLDPEQVAQNRTLNKMVGFIEIVEGCEDSCQVEDIKVRDKGGKERFDIKMVSGQKPLLSIVEITKATRHLKIVLM